MLSDATYKDLSQRNYYKIFTGSNQADGHEKIHLGYEASTFEIIFKKDKTTYFHAPFFSTPQKLVNTTLIAEGAIPGAIPAMADRIFKKQGGYGKNTPWGNTTQIKDGTWLCSWLFAGPNGTPQWLDRYFDPGRLSVSEALEQDVNILTYVKNNPVIYDIQSEMTIEPGVWYQYYHQGEKTSQQIIATFAGLSGDRIKLDIDDWSAKPLDKSQYNNEIYINNFQSDWIKTDSDPGFLDRNVLNFNNTNFINCYATYNDSYNLLNEFSLQFWFYNNNWKEAPFTQLIGNLSLGGYGVFYDNLKGYPYYAIPETTYGHLFYVNQNTEIYTEKNIQRNTQTNMKPVYSGLNSDYETVLVDLSSHRVYKYNHLGDVLGQSKLSDGSFYTLPGIPKTAIIDGQNNTHVLTTSGTFIFNQDLILTQQSLSQPYIQNEVLTFNLSGNLVREQNSVDVKFDNNNNKWSIKTDNKLYYNDTQIAFPGISATNLNVDPNGNIWVLADINNVYIYSSQTKNIIKQFNIGVSSFSTNKNITFVYRYDRKNNTKFWSAIILHGHDQTLYELTLNGDILKTIYIPEKLNIQYPLTVGQNPRNLTFTCKGDFTGYDWKRIFNKAHYNNEPQLHFKIAADQPTPTFYPSRFTLSTSVNDLTDNTWYLVTCTFKNNVMKLFINDVLHGTKKIPSNYDLVYAYKTNLYIGTPSGKTENLNVETNVDSLIWNGYIDSIRIYDYALDAFTTQNNFDSGTSTENINTRLQAFIRAKIIAQDLIWNIPTAPLEYIDTIERFFKHRLPGFKSPFFNIKLSGLKITDTSIRQKIENEIKAVINKTQPGYTKLLNVEWID